MRKILLIAVLILGLTGITADTVSAQDVSVRDTNRAEMSEKVRKEILSLPYYGAFDAIGFEINGDTVILNGYVVRPYTKNDAEEEVAEIPGVRRVINNIEVLPLSPNDDRIRLRVRRSIAAKGGLYRYLLGANPSIRIVVKNGRVMLEGYVANEADRNLANIAAREVSGTFEVTNNLKIERREM
jgi:hyperosmotically inducible protein